MSSNKPKDEAERRAEELVRIVPTSDPYGTLHLKIGDAVADWALADGAMNSKCDHIRRVIASAIRKAIEGRDRIMTDLLSESEAFHEGWRQGAAAMKASIIENIKTEWLGAASVGSIGKSWMAMILDAIEPQPPSHDGNGKLLPPSPVHLRAQRMELALRGLVEICGEISHGGGTEFGLALREAREALEELTNE